MFKPLPYRLLGPRFRVCEEIDLSPRCHGWALPGHPDCLPELDPGSKCGHDNGVLLRALDFGTMRNFAPQPGARGRLRPETAVCFSQLALQPLCGVFQRNNLRLSHGNANFAPGWGRGKGCTRTLMNASCGREHGPSLVADIGYVAKPSGAAWLRNRGGFLGLGMPREAVISSKRSSMP